MHLGTSASPRLKARLAGLCYLATIGVGAFDHIFVGGRLIVAGDAAATARNILASEQLYRLAFTLDLIPVYIMVTLLFYDLFKPVSPGLSRLAAFSSLVGGAVGSTIGLLQLAPLTVLSGSRALSAFDAGQLQGLATLLLGLHEVGFDISLVFFGFYCLLIGWLILGSTFLPRFVGVLMALGGLAYMTFSFAAFASPPAASILAPYALMLGTLGEASLTLWLLAVGLNASRWREQAAASRLGPP